AGAESPREQLRRFAMSCRLQNLTCEQAAGDQPSLILRSQLANSATHALVPPAGNSLDGAPAMELRITLEPLEQQAVPAGQHVQPFIPPGPLSTVECQSFETRIPLDPSLPPGRYRLRQELGWHTNVFNTISTVETSVAIPQ